MSSIFQLCNDQPCLFGCGAAIRVGLCTLSADFYSIMTLAQIGVGRRVELGSCLSSQNSYLFIYRSVSNLRRDFVCSFYKTPNYALVLNCKVFKLSI